MNLDELKRKREALEKELAGLIATEKAETEQKLQAAAMALITEIKSIGYRGYFFEAPAAEGDEMPFTITVSRKKTSSGTIARVGREIVITKSGEPGRKFASCKEACRVLTFDTGADSARRV
ncbi:MAG: hypothetical protein Q8M94_12825, partial [Ignavibacteria bacterium]|nr:hypothetical protein [Ignavibacteria bacterium]